MDRDDDALLEWASAAAAHNWAGARVSGVEPLRGDLSTRRFFRVVVEGSPDAPHSAILVDLGPHDLPAYVRALKLLDAPPAEPPWISVHEFLSDLRAPVPRLYAAGAGERALLVEDVGDVALFDAARRGNAADLYRLAVEQLLTLHVEGTRKAGPGFIASRIKYDGRLFLWELDEFVNVGCAEVASGSDVKALEPELRELAATLDRLPRVFSHRDYHGWNLLVVGASNKPELRIIDFQDALMAPAVQDLAVLLTTRDTGEVITPAIERRLLDFYFSGLTRRGAAQLQFTEFESSYRLCVLQHALKMIGRFIAFEHSGKPGYSRYVPHCAGQVRRMLTTESGGRFPKLREAFGAR